MEIISISSIYENQNISQDKTWRYIYNKLEEMGVFSEGKEVKLDFKGLVVIKPYRWEYFKMLLKHENVSMTFYDMGEDVKYIRIACLIEGVDCERIENVETVKKDSKTEKVDKNMERSIKEICELFSVDESGKRAKLELYRKYTSIMNSLTSVYIANAIDKWLSENKNIEYIVIELKDAYLNERVIDVLCEKQAYLGKKYGITIDIDTDNMGLVDQFELYIYKYTSDGYSEEDREMVLGSVKKGTAGILVKYKQTKALDAFGRKGKGEIVSSRAAIFRGLVRQDEGGEAFARFDIYFGDTLYTKEHSILTTGEEHPGLRMATIDISMDKLGVFDKFIGSDYHFILPMQKDEQESKELCTLDKDGTTKTVKYTIPELMKEVFEDFDIEYDTESLDKAIEDTKATLNANKQL